MLEVSRVLEIARAVIEDVAVGCLTNVSQGRPFARFMGAVAGDAQLDRLYSLSAHATGKVEQLQQQAEVCWVFASDNFEDVVTLRGRAVVRPTSDLPAWAYDRLVEFAKPYAVNVTTDPHYHYDAIITQVESVELLSPRLGLISPQQVRVE